MEDGVGPIAGEALVFAGDGDGGEFIQEMTEARADHWGRRTPSLDVPFGLAALRREMALAIQDLAGLLKRHR
jgi:hypothetical protein